VSPFFSLHRTNKAAIAAESVKTNKYNLGLFVVLGHEIKNKNKSRFLHL
jgi:hypothetical protein